MKVLIKNKKIAAGIVNALTLSRFPLSLCFIAGLVKERPFWESGILFLLIAATDFFDGILARACNAGSRAGAILDVAADFFFMITASYALCLQKALPFWIVLIIGAKMLEFILTSWIMRAGEKGGVFVFDAIGRFAALGFYLLPITVLALRIFLSGGALRQISLGLSFTLSIQALLSSAQRIGRSLKAASRRF